MTAVDMTQPFPGARETPAIVVYGYEQGKADIICDEPIPPIADVIGWLRDLADVMESGVDEISWPTTQN